MVAPEEIFELVYASAAVAPFSDAQLRELLSHAREKNTRLGITGMLLYSEGSLLQVLEGPEQKVRSLYETISRDPRHERVLQLLSAHRAKRSFAEWTMGYAAPSADMKLPGFNDFLKRGFTDTQYTAELKSKVRDIALQFRIGRWRQYVVDP